MSVSSNAAASPLSSAAATAMTIDSATSRIRLMTNSDPTEQELLKELLAAVDQYRIETEQGLRGTMAMRRAFAALAAVQNAMCKDDVSAVP